jgi:agmatinase
MIQGNFIPINFLGLDEENSRFDASKVVMLPVPFERTVSFGRGTSRGPSSIIYASRCLELYDDELGFEPSTLGIYTLPELECGSVDPAYMVDAFSEVCTQLLKSNKYNIYTTKIYGRFLLRVTEGS